MPTDPVGHDELDTALARQDATLRLRLATATFGARSIKLPDSGALTRIPVRLGPLEGTAILVGPPEASTDGPLVVTAWELQLVPDPDSPDWTPADLLEAFGVEVGRW